MWRAWAFLVPVGRGDGGRSAWGSGREGKCKGARRAPRRTPAGDVSFLDVGTGRNGMNLINDVRLALRSFVKRPGFSVPIVITLALGIGANTAVFSIVYSILLKPLPFPEPNRVVRVFDTQPSLDTAPAAHYEYADWHDRNRVFTAIGGIWPFMPTLSGTGEPQQLIGG